MFIEIDADISVIYNEPVLRTHRMVLTLASNVCPNEKWTIPIMSSFSCKDMNNTTYEKVQN